LTEFRVGLSKLEKFLTDASSDAAECVCELESIRRNGSKTSKHTGEDAQQTAQFRHLVKLLIEGGSLSGPQLVPLLGEDFRIKILKMNDRTKKIDNDVKTALQKVTSLGSKLQERFAQIKQPPQAVLGGSLTWEQHYESLYRSVTGLSLTFGLPGISAVRTYQLMLVTTDNRDQSSDFRVITQRYSGLLKFHLGIKGLLPAGHPSFPPKMVSLSCVSSDPLLNPEREDHQRKQMLQQYLDYAMILGHRQDGSQNHPAIKAAAAAAVRSKVWTFIYLAVDLQDQKDAAFAQLGALVPSKLTQAQHTTAVQQVTSARSSTELNRIMMAYS
jgi:hypothetical protein